MQNVTHVLTNEQSELRANTEDANRRRMNARANIGLDQVDNTSDADKPISSATQDALDTKMDVDNGTYLKSAEISGNGYTLTIRPNNGDVIEFQGGGIVETVQADWAENSPSDPSFIKNKPDLSGFATTSAMDTALEQKQDTIDDLNTIRSGAAAGATAVQPSVLDDYATTSDLATGLAGKQETIDDLSTIREGASAGATAVQPAALSAYATTSDVSNALADKQDVISDLSTIREGASSGATAVQPESLATVATTGKYEDLKGSPDMSTYATTNALNDAISGIRQVPVSEPADLNKVLTVNGSGTPVWAPAQGGGGGGASVNDVTVNGTSVVDSNGVGVVIVPTKTSDLQNDSGFITSVPVTGVEVDGTSVVNGQGVAEINLPAQAQANWDESDSSDPSYIQNKPTIPAAQVNADWTASSGVAQILNKPSIPLATSDLTNDSGYITASDVPAAQVNADWTASSGVAEILHKPTIPSATSDLTNDSGFITTSDVPAAQEQADWNESDTTDPAYIKNKPTIPAAQVNADWTASSGVAEILHKPSIPSATSDLTNDSGFITASDVPSAQAQADWDESDSSDSSYIKNKPTIPAAQVNSDWNASSGVAQILNKPSIPTATSDLTNDSGFITSSDIPAQAQANWNEMDTSDPSYIQNKPTIPAAQVNSDWTASSGVAEILHKPNIPSATSDLTNDSGFITSSDVPAAQEQADWNESDTTDPAYIKNKPTIPAAQVNADWNSSTGVSKILNKPSIPTNTSDLNNDSGFITVSDIPAQVQADWTETDNTKASFVKNKPTIPTVPVTDVTVDGTSVLNNGTAEVVIPVKDVTVGGSSVVSNQGVAAITIPAQVQADWTESDNTKASFVKNKPTLATVATSGSYGDLSNAPTLASVATSGDYDDLTNKPTIPAAQVNSDWDASSGVAQILNKPSIPSVDQSYGASSTNAQSGTAVAEAIGTVRQVPSTQSSDNGKVLGVTDTSGLLGWVDQPADELPSITGNGGKVLKVNAGATAVEWDDDIDTTYESKTAAEGGTDVSLVTTGEKYTWNHKQDALSFDGTYNASSNKVATESTVSSAVQALDAEVTSSDGTNVQVKVTEANGNITAVNITTDNTESKSNKKQSIDSTSETEYPSSKAVANFVNSSVATATAKFLGNFTLTDLNLSYGATNAQIEAKLDAYSWPSGTTPTNNDYVYVEIENPQTTGIDDEVRRFKFNGTGWAYEYTLNNSSFTADEKAAIDSGITATAVSNYNSHISDTDIHVTTSDKNAWNAKYVKPSGGIPKTDMADAVQTSLGKADTALQSHQDISGKADKVSGATSGNFAALDGNGNLIDSSSKASDFATSSQGALAASAVQPEDLATVATSGDYDDLLNKPTIPAAQVSADWNATSGVAQILNKPTLSVVATSGAYADLTGTPTVDQSYGASSTNAQSGTAVANAISGKADKVSGATTGNFAGLDGNGNITDSGSKAGDFATSSQGTKADSAIQTVKVNGSALTPDANKAVDITVPAAQVKSDWNSSSGLSEILNKPDLSVYALKSEMSVVAGTGTDADKTTITLKSGTAATVLTTHQDITGKQDVISDLSTIRSGAEAGATAYQKPSGGIPDTDLSSSVQTSLGKADTAVQPGDLAMVATSGSYTDLSNTPDLSGYALSSSLATVATSGDYNDLDNLPTIPTVDQSYDAASANAQSGVAVASAISDKADKVSSATNGNFAGLDSNGNLTDSGSKASDFATAAQGSLADSAYQLPSGGMPSTDMASAVQTSLGKADSALQGVKVNSTALTPDANHVVDITINNSTVTIDMAGTATSPNRTVGSFTVDQSSASTITIPAAVSAVPAVLDQNNEIVTAAEPALPGVLSSSDKDKLDSLYNVVGSTSIAIDASTHAASVIVEADGGIVSGSSGLIAQPDLVSRVVYVGNDCVYNDKTFWSNPTTVDGIIADYANQTVTDYRGNGVPLARFVAEYDSNRYRIANIDETPGTVEYNRKIGGQIIDLMRSDFWMSSHPTYDIIKFDKDMDELFDLLMTGSPMNAYLLLNEMTSTAFITDARREMYMDMIKAYDAWPYADKDTAYADFMAEHALDRFVQVSTTWPLNSWNSYRYVMAGTKTATDKVIFVIRHAERDDDTSVNGDINSTGVTTCTTMGEQARNNASWTSGSTTYRIDNFPANDATYYSTEYLRCKHSAQAFASARYDTDFDASDYSEITVEADMLNQYRFFYQPASSGNSTLIRNYSVDPTRLSSSELSDYFGVSTAAEAQEKLSTDYVRVCKEILNKSTARLNMFYTHDYFTLPLAVMASNKYFDFSGNSSADNRNWINYCAGIGMILHPDNTYEVMPVRGKSNGSMTI